MDNAYYDIMGDIESYGKYDANRKGSAYYGKYQFHEGSATPYLEKIGKTWADYQKDPKVQEQVVRMETDNNKRIMAGWGHKNPSQLDLWTAHNLGIGNMRKIYKGNVSDADLLSAIANQKGGSKTVDEYMAYYGSKFGSPVKEQPAMVKASPDGLGANPKPERPDQSVRIAELFKGLGELNKPTEDVYIEPSAGLGTFAGF